MTYGQTNDGSGQVGTGSQRRKRVGRHFAIVDGQRTVEARSDPGNFCPGHWQPCLRNRPSFSRPATILVNETNNATKKSNAMVCQSAPKHLVSAFFFRHVALKPEVIAKLISTDNDNYRSQLTLRAEILGRTWGNAVELQA